MSELPSDLNQLFNFIDDHKSKYIDALRTAVAIPSVSVWPEKREEVERMVRWTEDKLKELGAETRLADIGKETLANGEEIPLPKVLLATIGKDTNKNTVLIYGHLDVQPALKEDGWATEPFELTEIDGKLWGRGSTDDKGPVLCWIHAIEAYQKLNIDLPVNVKFVLEGMEESDSEGLDELLMSLKNDFLHDVDYVCISDNYWLGKTKPCLTYGLRGLVYYYIEIECAQKDLHSGVFGGTVHEAMPDLCWLLSTLVDKDTKILIPGIERDIVPLLHNELEIYDKIDFDVEEYKKDVGSTSLPHNENKSQLLMHRWRYPSLSIHGIEGAFSEAGAKTVIPAKVIGKFSIRLVDNQDPDHVTECVLKYLNEKWTERGSPNKMNVKLINSAKSWSGDPNHPHYEAAKRATKHVFHVEPDMTREGGSIPITLTLQEATGKSVILVPVGASDDGAHSQKEKIDIYNYIEGTKLLGAYLYEVSQLN
ncbi:cytosolic non-specific dipeptidase-like [Lucilia sericata]|uniref:cytosolic non-specific dipeptidase-like n=1 Tax=Lucilia sericata TaxID=13632 RepID=UPI0018A7EA78|nr:cytosolic non-specific dipeptidase-like [Lucilia sericata]XP_037822687.1 cytosolic non-specific dipeptidase-like [Lucilia sericata]XP_037822688.1 cytosolic non-specific dipeptidase-like [Lucilia sericata]XP_037822690.1 cytosolic non-specific dipeptidase-like [Lucilia sericata]XP_037822691.1 cytosolic non-specific dipeptidase-like [Lucilia sericata]